VAKRGREAVESAHARQAGGRPEWRALAHSTPIFCMLWRPACCVLCVLCDPHFAWVGSGTRISLGVLLFLTMPRADPCAWNVQTQGSGRQAGVGDLAHRKQGARPGAREAGRCLSPFSLLHHAPAVFAPCCLAHFTEAITPAPAPGFCHCCATMSESGRRSWSSSLCKVHEAAGSKGLSRNPKP
jgi:hypothetical protein